MSYRQHDKKSIDHIISHDTYAYEGYSFLLDEIENASDITNSSKEFECSKVFRDFCSDEWENRNSYAKAWRGNANEDVYPSYLYKNAQGFMSCENPDGAYGAVLVDRLDFHIDLSANVNLPLEKSTMAFCPDINSFLVNTEGRDHYPFLNKPHELFSDTEDIPPLQVFIKMKLNFLATVGPGLLLQKAIYRAIIKTTKKTLLDLDKDPDYHSILYAKDSVTNIDNLKLCLLDTQDWSDLAILIRTHDFRISSALVIAVSAITFEDILTASDDFDIREKLELLLKDDRTSPFALFTKIGKSPDKTIHGIDLLQQNHVFSSIYSTSGVSEKTYFNIVSGRNRTLGGITKQSMLRSVVKIKCFEGHDSSLWQELDKFLDSPRYVNNATLDGKKWTLSENGVFDYSISLESVDGVRIYSLQDFLRFDYALKTQALPSKGESRQGNPPVWNIRNVDYKIGIPTGRNIIPPITGREHCYLDRKLIKIITPLFEKNGILELVKLEENIRLAGIAPTTSHEILSLFKSFKKSLLDSCSFSSVIDLWDGFITLYVFVIDATERIIRSLESEKNHFNFFRISFPTEGRDYNDLKVWIRTLKESLNLRLRDSLNREGTHTATVSTRMATVQLVSSVDAVMKCVSGVIKNLRKQKHMGAYSVFSYISEDPTPQVSQLFSMGEFSGASINMSLDHLVHASSHISYIHEAGHLLYNFYEDGEKEPPTLEEIFCEQIVLLWVFDSNDELYTRSFVSRIKGFLSRASTDPLDRINEIGIYLTRLYFTVLHTRTITPPLRDAINQDTLHQNLELVVKDYALWLTNLYTTEFFIFPEVEDIDSWIAQECSIFSDLVSKPNSGYLTSGKTWKFAEDISQQCVFFQDSSFKKTWQNDYVFENCVKEGKAISRLSMPCENALAEDVNFADSLLLVRKLLQQISADLYGENGLCSLKSVLKRNNIGAPDMSATLNKDNKTLITDLRRRRHFSLCPIDSEKVMRMRISIIKSFWDISCIMKAKRIKDMFHQVIPKKRP